VVDDGQIAHLRLVRTGKIVGEQIEIVSGLKQGQRYITLIPPQMRMA
jgi:hypothetical protein